MNYLSVLLVGLFLLTSCVNSEKETKTDVTSMKVDKPEPSQEEQQKNTQKLISKVIDVSELNLQMNGTDKWMINDSSYTMLMKIKQQIYVISGNMENYEISSYNKMGKEFFEFVSTIPALEDEKANKELKKVISNTQSQVTFMMGTNLQESQIAIINLSMIYDEVPEYFESSSK
tara:strand:- start:13454 stop:13975 length:522 start_codon:yes stop_codon:yes gene_type:complete